MRQVREDALLPGRTHERLTQLHRGIPVFGGELVRQTGPAGATVSVFGTLYEGIELDATPLLSRAQVESLVAKRGLAPFGSEGTPELTILPLDSGGYALTYRLRAVPLGSAKIRMVFLDARTGDVVLEYSDLQTQAAVGSATGVLFDAKKISASPGGAGFIADDRLRPPVILTYDFKGDLSRLLLIDDVSQLQSSDLATDTDNTWTDGANVDAHVYIGYTYDYYFKRLGRRGLDNANIADLRHHPPGRGATTSSALGRRHHRRFLLNAFYVRRRPRWCYRRGGPAPGFTVAAARPATTSPARSTWWPTS